MIKNILWDFDGVILNSMKIKGDGFVELFKEYDNKKVILLEEYHYTNGGISRFEKIRYFFNEILQENIVDEKVMQLANNFGKIIENQIFNKSNLIEDSLEFIKTNYTKYNFHIVSGAEHNELNNLCKIFELNKYFKSINGSPIKKEILVKDVISNYTYQKQETILIGDAITDYNSAMKNGIKFYGYNNEDLKQYGYYIDSFKEIKF